MKKRHSISVMLCAAYIIVIIGVADAGRSSQSANSTSAVADRQRYFGVHTNKLDTQGAAELSYLGATMVRTDVFAWDSVEPERGRFDFTKADAAIQWAGTQGVKLLGVLMYTPPWENGGTAEPINESPNDCGIAPEQTRKGSYGEQRVIPPRDIDAYVNYVYEVVRRYPEVRYWQIWNEPNNPIFWQPRPSASAYARMLKASFAAVKRANPNAQVVIGGISLMDTDYISKLYAAGARNSFDIMAVHPYSPEQRPGDYIPQEFLKLKKVMDRYGDRETPVWITEIGWFTGTSPRAVSEAQQADNVWKLYDALGRLNYVGPVFWHTLEDCTENYRSDEPEHNYGLFSRNHMPKPAAVEYRALLKK